MKTVELKHWHKETRTYSLFGWITLFRITRTTTGTQDEGLR